MTLQLRSKGRNLELRSKEGHGRREGESLPGTSCPGVRGLEEGQPAGSCLQEGPRGQQSGGVDAIGDTARALAM